MTPEQHKRWDVMVADWRDGDASIVSKALGLEEERAVVLAVADDLTDLARERDILVAWEFGALTEGQAATLLGVDRLTLREMKQTVLERAEKLWVKYRKEHPPEYMKGTSG